MNNSILIFPLSIIFLLTFMKFRISSKCFSWVISFVASSIFSVYLISEHPQLRDYIWKLAMEIVADKSILIPIYVVFISCAIMFICIIIDQFRKLVFLIFSKTGFPQKIANNFDALFKRIYADL